MKLLTSLAILSFLPLPMAPAAAQDVASFYKGKTVRISVGFSAGGGYDHYARVLSRHLGRHIPGNPTVLVQNQPGAASLTSVKYTSAAAPTDGTFINAFNPGLITQSLTVPKKVGINFLEFGWLGNISEDFRVCHTWHAAGIKTWQDLLARPRVSMGNTGIGTSAYIDNRILSDLFGVKLQQVMGYPGSAEKKIALERGELDGDCGSWTSLPEEWLRDKKLDIHIRYSRTLVPGMPESAINAREHLTDPKKRQTFDLLTASALIGRPYIVPKAVPADRFAALRGAFDATMKDPEFLADAAKQRLTVTAMTGPEVEGFIKDLYQTPPDVVTAARTISGD
jgi:tripartite-type tricarboxylate transporter receptor subunit TctC